MRQRNFTFFIVGMVLALGSRVLGQGQAVEPTSKPQEINETVAHETPTPHAPTHKVAGVTVETGETYSSLKVEGQTVTVRGTVEGDLEVINGKLSLETGAKVGGMVRLENSELSNTSGKSFRIETRMGEQSDDTPPASATVSMVHRSADSRASVPIRINSPTWFDQQFALLIIGLVCGGLFLAVAPHATERVSTTISLETSRCLIVGVLSAVGLGMLSLLNAGLLNVGALRLAWSPFGFAVAVGTLCVVAFGWVAGMRHIGNRCAHRLGRHDDGTLFGRIALGVLACSFVGWLAGSLFSGFQGLVLLGHGLIATLGLGASVITRFGHETNWLGIMLDGGPRFRSR